MHDWFYTNGGAEKVVRSINQIFPETDNFGLIDFLGEEDREEILNGKKTQVSFIQDLPTAKSNHRKFLQLFPLAIEQFDLSEYDIVISSSSSIAKGVLTNHKQLHFCYCHSPMRYAWDLYFQYLKESKVTSGIKSAYVRYVLHKMRMWDIATVNRVDYFIANSKYIAQRIKKVYNRETRVIYPPVDVDRFQLNPNKQDYYFTASRMVPYKKIETIVEAFNQMSDKKLIVAGDGPEFKKISKIACDNVKLLGYLDSKSLVNYMSEAKAFVFAAEEDFGIVPVEAQACGTPVIGYGIGGVSETVADNKSGILFYRQDPRLHLYQQSMDIFKESPFIGLGAGQAEYLLKQKQEEEGASTILNNAHNQYLEYLMDGGILMILIFLWILISLGNRFWIKKNIIGLVIL